MFTKFTKYEINIVLIKSEKKKNGKESILLDIVRLIGSRSPVDTKNVCT